MADLPMFISTPADQQVFDQYSVREELRCAMVPVDRTDGLVLLECFSCGAKKVVAARHWLETAQQHEQSGAWVRHHFSVWEDECRCCGRHISEFPAR